MSSGGPGHVASRVLVVEDSGPTQRAGFLWTEARYVLAAAWLGDGSQTLLGVRID
ncbi:MAG: hypothetical protein H7323_06195 [Frankiales bacterium]|nr:hypothetical protein [Frankiales bacterium]